MGVSDMETNRASMRMRFNMVDEPKEESRSGQEYADFSFDGSNILLIVGFDALMLDEQTGLVRKRRWIPYTWISTCVHKQ